MIEKLKLMWTLLRGQRTRYFAAIASLIVASCFMYAVPLIATATMNVALADGTDEAEPTAILQLLVSAMGGADYVREHLWIPLIAIAIVAAVAGLFTYLRGRWAAIASESIVRRVRDDLYTRLQDATARRHDTAETGDQVQRCTSDVETLRLFLSMQVVEIGRAIIMLMIPIPLMYHLHPRMTIASLVTVPPIVVFALLFFKKVRAAFKKSDEAEGRLTSTLQENLTGIRVVRAFARQDFEQDKFRERNDTHRRADFGLYHLMAWYWASSDLLCFTQKAVVVAFGAYYLWTGQIEVGTFYFFLSAVSMFIWPVRMMGRILTDLGKALVALTRIDEIMTAETEQETDVMRWNSAVAPAIPPETWTGRLVFDDVRFSHAQQADVLRGVSFVAEPGQTIAMLGPSGAGKSTIIHLLLRLYDAESGRITLDGVDIRDLDRRTLRRQMAVVLQEPFLYSKTIRENIGIGRGTVNDEELMEAAVTACIHESINQFDDGYDTKVGERGVTLSGGQRQRVAIARALLQEPAVLILDDALSAVDTRTETLIIEALQRRQGRHTTLVIAHRLSTLKHADRILVLEHGQIVQAGTHDELLAQDGRYRRLWWSQTALEEDLAQELELLGDGTEDARSAGSRLTTAPAHEADQLT
jgi:ATP-binding cassette subfamily B protein